MIDILAFVLMAGSGVFFLSSLLEGKSSPDKTELDQYLLPLLKPNASRLSDAGKNELITFIKTLGDSDEAGKK
jgi:hypothetical protein